MTLVTPENASLRSGWRVTPMGRIVHPIRMRPEKPLPPMSTVTSNTAGKKVERKKRKLEQVKLVRARRRTIDPTKWDSQHLKGAFLDSIVVADDRDDLPGSQPSRPQTPNDDGESDFSSGEEDGEGGAGSDSSEYETTAAESQTNSGTMSRPPPTTRAESDEVDTDLDFNQEKLRALSLLDSMFGGLERNQEWGGKEALDSDIDMSGLPPVQPSLSPRPAVEKVQQDLENEESSTEVPAPALEPIPASVTIQNATTKAKLKDLFAPQEEQGAHPLARRLLSIRLSSYRLLPH